MEFVEFIVKYGAEVAFLALLSITATGLVKVVFKKQFDAASKGACKTIYEILSTIFVAGFTALYLAIMSKFFGAEMPSLAEAAAKASTVFVAVKVMYPVYENYHIRDLVKLLLRGLKAIFKKKKEEPKPETEDKDKTIVI